MNYVYRFINNDSEIIYVGKTKDMKKRYNEKFSSGHLKDECYKQRKRTEYIKVETQPDATIKEIYYINLYKPKYNSKQKYEENLNISLPDDDWQEYKPHYEEQIRQLKETIQIYEKRMSYLENIYDPKKEIQKLRMENSRLEHNSIIYFVNKAEKDKKIKAALDEIDKLKIELKERKECGFMTNRIEVIYKDPIKLIDAVLDVLRELFRL